MVEFRDCRGEVVRWDDEDVTPFDPPIMPPDGDLEAPAARTRRREPDTETEIAADDQR